MNNRISSRNRYTCSEGEQLWQVTPVAKFFVGDGVGVAIGILFAPAAGQQTREAIKSKADEGKEYLKRQSSALRGSQIFEKAMGTVVDATQAGKPLQSTVTQPKTPQSEISRSQSDQIAGFEL